MNTNDSLNLSENENIVLQNFFLLIFTPDPTKSQVKVIVDDNILRAIYKTKVFEQIILETCGLKLANQVDFLCHEYGGYFCINREKKTIQKLNNTQVYEKLTANDIKPETKSDKSNQITLDKLTNDVLSLNKWAEIENTRKNSALTNKLYKSNSY